MDHLTLGIPEAAAIAVALVVVGAWATHVWLTRRTTKTTASPKPKAVSELNTALGQLPIAAIVVNTNGRALVASPAARELGLLSGDQLDRRLLSLVGSVRKSGQVKERQFEREPGTGGVTEIWAKVAPLRPGRFLLLAEDRSEARRLEQMRRDFIVNASHELKTPVGALSLLAETVSDAADDPVAVRRFSKQMRTEARRLSDLVHEIIDLSRVQDGGLMPHTAQADLAAVVTEALDRSRTVAESRSVTFSANICGPVLVPGDHDLLVTAVRNLLDNAVTYSPEESEVGVSLSADETDARIAVVDRGVGIAPKELDRVFERFYRVDPARSRDTGGTGLGLAIARRVAADHGGEIQVWSKPGLGSTFTLRLPTGNTPEGVETDARAKEASR